MKSVVVAALAAVLCLLLFVSFVSAQSTPTPTATVSAQINLVALKDANLRGGPGITFAIVGGVRQGDKMTAIGKSADGAWYELTGKRWIAAFLVRPASTGSSVTAVVTATAQIRPVVPTPTATPAPILGSLPYTFTGTGDSILDVSAYNDKAILLMIVGNASESYFGVTAYDALGEQNDLLVNTTEYYVGLRPLNLTNPPTEFLEIKAEGQWKIVAIELLAATIIRQGTLYSNEGDYVVLIADSPSARTATITGNASGSYFGIHGYSTTARQLLVNTTDPYIGVVRLNRGTFLLVIQATGEWSIAVN